MTARLPVHLEIAAIRRLAEGQGGHAMVLNKGDRDAGTILLQTTDRGRDAQYWERMPQLDGTRAWTLVEVQDDENEEEYWLKRRRQDPDLWVLEIDVPNSPQFTAQLPV